MREWTVPLGGPYGTALRRLDPMDRRREVDPMSQPAQHSTP